MQPDSKQKKTLKFLLTRVKNLGNSDPHYIAMGLAAGVFISITPTIPFHTVLALLLATIIKGSKTAAALGVWFSNPITLPVIYVANYKVGTLILGTQKSLDITKINSISYILQIGIDLTISMIIGGIILGIIPAISSYFIIRWVFVRMKANNKKYK